MAVGGCGGAADHRRGDGIRWRTARSADADFLTDLLGEAAARRRGGRVAPSPAGPRSWSTAVRPLRRRLAPDGRRRCRGRVGIADRRHLDPMLHGRRPRLRLHRPGGPRALRRGRGVPARPGRRPEAAGGVGRPGPGGGPRTAPPRHRAGRSGRRSPPAGGPRVRRRRRGRGDPGDPTLGHPGHGRRSTTWPVDDMDESPVDPSPVPAGAVTLSWSDSASATSSRHGTRGQTLGPGRTDDARAAVGAFPPVPPDLKREHGCLVISPCRPGAWSSGAPRVRRTPAARRPAGPSARSPARPRRAPARHADRGRLAGSLRTTRRR